MPITSCKKPGRSTIGLRIAIALLSFSTATIPSVRAQASADQNAVRKVIGLKEGWRLNYGAAPATVSDLAFDDARWQKVSVPHTWNRVGFYSVTQGPDAN